MQVGFTTLPRSMCFSPVKNNVVDAGKKQAAGLPIECAGSAECDAYRYPTLACLSSLCYFVHAPSYAYTSLLHSTVSLRHPVSRLTARCLVVARLNARLLELAGAEVATSHTIATYAGISLEFPPLVRPSWAPPCLARIHARTHTHTHMHACMVPWRDAAGFDPGMPALPGVHPHGLSLDTSVTVLRWLRLSMLVFFHVAPHLNLQGVYI